MASEAGPEVAAGGPPGWSRWGAVALTALAGGAGTYFSLGAWSAAADRDSTNDPVAWAAARDLAAGDASRANVSFAVAGAAALTATVLWLWSAVADGPADPPQPAVTAVSAVAGPAGWTVGFHAGF